MPSHPVFREQDALLELQGDPTSVRLQTGDHSEALHTHGEGQAGQHLPLQILPPHPSLPLPLSALSLMVGCHLQHGSDACTNLGSVAHVPSPSP